LRLPSIFVFTNFILAWQKKKDNKKARQKAGFFDNLSQAKISKI